MVNEWLPFSLRRVCVACGNGSITISLHDVDATDHQVEQRQSSIVLVYRCGLAVAVALEALTNSVPSPLKVGETAVSRPRLP